MRIFCTTTALFLVLSAGSVFADGFEVESAPPVKERETRVSAPLFERAKGEDLSSAIGHYAKARSLLVAAIHEFDRGYRLARPDSLLDSEEWRHSLISRAEDLEKVLSPQPRVTREGVRFEGDSRLLNLGNGPKNSEAKKK